MGRINVLGFDIANLIAAGEVVDRPASVVKELLENAVDSGAHHITVEIRNGGITHIRVSDDGCGMEADDIPLCVLRHATSKIKTSDDLNGILTLGFRGEALAAIASVTKLEIYSKRPGDSIGTYMLCEGGEIVELCEAGCSEGTTVIASELFYNVPARRKFLKRDATEGAKISEIVEKIALSTPNVSIKYIYDSQVRFMTPGDGNLKNAAYAVYGRKIASRLVEADRTENGIRVYGYVTDADMNFAKRSQELFFVNGRYVRSPLLFASLERAYVSKIPSDRFPMSILNIAVPPEAVDVNVHPTKLEVKFSNERIISEAVHFAVLTALEKSVSRPEMVFGAPFGGSNSSSGEIPKKRDDFFVSGKDAIKVLNAFVPVERDKTQRSVQASIDELDPTIENKKDSKIKSTGVASGIMAGYNIPKAPTQMLPLEQVPTDSLAKIDEGAVKYEDFSSASVKMTDEVENKAGSVSAATAEAKQDAPVPTSSESRERGKIPKYSIIGEAFNCYVIVELEDRLLMIDKHAAHERILFDSLCERMKKKEKESQSLIAPLEMTLTDDELLCAAEYLDNIKSVGFDITLDGKEKTLSIHSIPTLIDASVACEMISAIISRICEGIGTVESTEAEFFEKALYQASCKAAIKGGRYYGIEHIKWICDRLLKDPGEDGKVIKTCPHGRPVAFEIKKSSIERQFSRLE